MTESIHITKSNNRSFVLMAIAIILYMLSSNRILYVRYIPLTIIYMFIFFPELVYLKNNPNKILKTSSFNFFCIITLTIIWLYDQVWLNGLNIISVFGTFLTIGCAMCILNFSQIEKKIMLRMFIVTVQCIVGIALIGWILFLIHVPLPHFMDLSDAYYIHAVYYIFNLNGYPENAILPRFAGPFLEPGHLGTMCVFILYVGHFNLKKIGNIILLLGVLFSLSLAAYGLMVGAVILTLINQKRWFWLVGIVSIFILSGVVAMLYNSGDNPINQAIVMRLEMDESGEIAGNNRTSGAFDFAYERFLKSNDIWFGLGSRAFGKRGDGSDNITIGCATYKRYFFLRGIFGSMLIIFFLLWYWYKYRNKFSFGFLIVYIVANCIRDYPTLEMWMFFYLLAIPVLGEKHKALNLCQKFNRYSLQ